MTSRQEIKMVSTDSLIPYDRNPKTHPDSQIEQLKNSIRQWGWTIPILIDENNQVIAGHGRLFAAKGLEMEAVPCITAEGWSDEQKKAYVIADNKLAEGGEWDTPLYFSELKAISAAGFNLELVGFDSSISLDFEPNLDPSTSFADVNEDDIGNAKSSLSDNMDRLTGDRSARGTEVMCPYCAESFTFDGL